MPQITPFQITLSLQEKRSENTPDFHLALRQQRKNFRFFINSPDAEFGGKSEIFEKSEILKKSEIFGFEKFYKNYFIFFFKKIEEDDRKK